MISEEVDKDGTGKPGKYLFTFKISMFYRLGNTEHGKKFHSLAVRRAKRFVQIDGTLQYKGEIPHHIRLTDGGE